MKEKGDSLSMCERVLYGKKMLFGFPLSCVCWGEVEL